MKPNHQSELDSFTDFCLKHWNDPYHNLESNPELMAKLEDGVQNLLLPACEEGDENAMFWMAECYDVGWGIEPNGQKAFALRRKLAEMGHTDQQINMGNYYRESDLVKRNPRAAFCWYMRAAKQGDWYGQLLVADCYFKGDGVKLDYIEAVKWYELTAAHLDKNGVLNWAYPVGYPASLIAQCYREGLGVKKNLSKAIKWGMKAAHNGCVHGQALLANALLEGSFEGEPVEQDREKAILWLRNAAKKGYKTAMKKLAELGFQNGL